MPMLILDQPQWWWKAKAREKRLQHTNRRRVMFGVFLLALLLFSPALNFFR